MNFYKLPFVFITILFAIGVDFQSQMGISESWLALMICLLSISIFLLNYFKESFSHFLQVGLFSIVIFLLGGALLKSKQSSFEKLYEGNEKTMFVKVQEIASKEKLWRKSVCEVNYLIDADTVRKMSQNILLYFDGNEVQEGDVLLVNTVVKGIENKNNPGEFNAKKYWSTKNIFSIGFVSSFDFLLIDHKEKSWVSSKLKQVRGFLSLVLEKYLDGDELALAKALVLGDKELLTPEIRTSFSKAGAMHVLAVSGLHVGIVLYLLMWIFSKFPRLFSKQAALIISLLILWIYAGVTGFSPSVLRATIMFTILTIGGVIGRSTSSMNILFFSAFILLVWNPMFIYDIGFQLSYLAMIGIFTLYRPISRLIYFKNRWLTKIWEGTAIGIAAQLVTFPLTLYYFHQFPNYFALTNVGMMIFSGFSLGLSLFLFTINWFGFVAKLVGLALVFTFSSMLFFIQFIESLPGSVAKGFEYSSEFVLVMYAVILILYLFISMRKVFVGGVVAAIALFLFIQFVRFENLIANELVIFNSNNIILSIKESNRIDCYYFGNEKALKEADYLLNNYEKVRPGKIYFHKIEKGLTSFSNQQNTVDLKFNGNNLFLVVNDKAYVLKMNYKKLDSKKATVIEMPYLKLNSSRFHLKNGAVILELN